MPEPRPLAAPPPRPEPHSELPPLVWTEPFRVRAYEIGPDARLALPPLCDWLQEAAGNHATTLGVATDRLLETGRAWVLTRLQVEVTRYPRWREAVVLHTWPSAAGGLYAQRDFLLADADGAPLARATSQWLVIDVARRRPLRLPPDVLRIARPDRPHALDPAREPVPNFADATEDRRFTVRRRDLDLNEHVNNVRYVEWALEAVPAPLSGTHACRALDVQFKAESVYGDAVRSACAPAGEGALLHRVSREADGRELAVLRTQWGPAG